MAADKGPYSNITLQLHRVSAITTLLASFKGAVGTAVMLLFDEKLYNI